METDFAFKMGNSSISPSVPTKQNPTDDFYNMKNTKRGLALIFNHKYFDHPNLNDRNGTEMDCYALERIFKKLKFNVKIYNDLTRLDILKTLDDVSKMDHTDSDCLVISIMSHGENGIIYAKDSDYKSSDFIDLFTADKCPTLAGKPKLFFIQACRGDKFEDGTKLKYKPDEVDKITSNKSTTYSIPTMADILIMYSSVEGYYSWRDTKNGSPFIQSLVEQLDKHHNERDLLTILTFVNRQVAIDYVFHLNGNNNDKKKQMCCIVSQLTRLLYFH